MNWSEILKIHLTPSQIIIDLMVICMIIGLIDYIFGNKNRLGSRFTEGFAAFGSIALTMSGIIVLVPLIGQAISPVAPLFLSLGIDPAIFSGAILANDMGGYQLATEIAASHEGAGLGGMILASMMGVNIVFNIPVSLGIIKEDDRPLMAKGVLCGFITIPIGCAVGGLCAGYPIGMLLRNLIPIVIIAAVISLLLFLIPNIITKIFIICGRAVGIIAAVAAVIAIFTRLTEIPVIPGLGSIDGAMDVVVSIILVLPGAYVMVELFSRLMKRPFGAVGGLLGINDKATLGLLSSLANCVPTFGLIADMDDRGKVLNFAFLVSAGFALGDHLAYCSASAPSLVIPMVVGKLAGGISALILAFFITKKCQVHQNKKYFSK